MTLPWTVWTALAAAMVLQLAPSRWRHVFLQRTAAVVVWTSLLLTLCANSIGPAAALDSLARGGLWVALVWSVGFCAVINPSRLWLIVAGLGAIACGEDWLALSLGWELVRQATTRHASGGEMPRPSLGLWTALAAWLFATGSLQLDDVAAVLRHSYAAQEPDVSLGRPSLVIAGAACLTVLAVLAPCFTARHRSTPAAGDHLAQWLASVLFLARCCGEVFVGLEGPVTWVLLVAAGLAWLLALRALAQPSHWERLWRGCVLWLLALSLTWLVLVVLERTSATGGWPTMTGVGWARAALLADLLHGIAVLAGATTAVRLLTRSQRPAEFLDDLRGAGRDHPAWSLLLLVPLASLIGVPPLMGGGLRLLQIVSAWTLPQPAPNDTLVLHYGLLVLQGAGLAAWVLLSGSLLTVFRTVWWEPALSTWSARRSLWDWGLAVVISAAIVTAGAWATLWVR